jgi:glycosyltransferase involved in cell wall biosynthesis
VIRYSVVIPLFNKERHIERAVRSAAAQTTIPSEIIVVDDGSTDGSASVVTRLAREIAILRLIQQENGGVSRARNVGIQNAGSEFIAFLDSDDEWFHDFLEEIGHLINKFPNAGIYSTAYTAVGEDASTFSARFKRLSPTSMHFLIRNYFKAGFGGSPVWTSATVVPKRIFEDTGFFIEGAGRGQDLEMWGRISLGYDIAFSRKVCAIYYLDADNRSNTEGMRARLPRYSRWWVLDHMEKWLELPGVTDEKKRWIREWIRKSELVSALQKVRSAKRLKPLFQLPLRTLFSYSAFYYISRFLDKKRLGLFK